MAQPTMQQVAELAGVSTALVSLVMRDAPNVSDYRRQLVLAAADELGYRPNVLARNLASRRTQTIGVVLNDLHNPFFAEILDGLQAAADESDYRLLIGNGSHSQLGEERSVETFLQFRADGLVIAGSMLSDDLLERTSRTAPIVVVGRTSSSKVFDTANTDDQVGARLVIDHLVALGHQRIAHIDGGRGAGVIERRAGYRTAMRAHGLGEHIHVVRGDFTEAGGRKAAQTLMQHDRRPTAIFAGNDLSAVGALDIVENLGFDVPGDVSIVGYDNTALAAMHHVSLTTINQPTEELGRAAIGLLLERLDGDRTKATHHVAEPELIRRSTSDSPPAS
ncbi:LacI family DNA-binding transcriptional regulator [Ilumatobacter sp.]|uniref:LacI family DNA-binding transcriptional regulator n=1 Tax=Ilumatobacter sp. TaxID=1967498 RepID=UPI00309759B5